MNEETLKLGSSRRIIYTGLHVLEFMRLMEMQRFMAFCISVKVGQHQVHSIVTPQLVGIVQTTPS